MDSHECWWGAHGVSPNTGLVTFGLLIRKMLHEIDIMPVVLNQHSCKRSVSRVGVEPGVFLLALKRLRNLFAVEVMPTISVFFGIIIRMFYRDHSPPHFHAEYQGQNAIFDFDGKLLEGEIDSRTAKGLIRKWARMHKAELNKNWENMRQRKGFMRIEPLR